MHTGDFDFSADFRAFLLEGIGEYLPAKQRSARWLGLTVAGDARLVPNLKRGQRYPAAVLIALCERLIAFYSEQSANAEPRRLTA